MTDMKQLPAFAIVQSSPQAMNVEPKKQSPLKVYPFDDLQTGQSFTAKIDEVNWKSLRICVYKQNGRKGGKEFKFIKHDDLGIVEVARIA